MRSSGEIKRDSDIAEIERTISELRGEMLTYQVCERLACLYLLHDRLCAERSEGEKAVEVTKQTSAYSFLDDGDFSECVKNRDMTQVWRVVEELIETVKLNYPKVYNRFYHAILACEENDGR